MGQRRYAAPRRGLAFFRRGGRAAWFAALACGASTSRLSGSTRSSPWSHSLLCPIRCRRPFSTGRCAFCPRQPATCSPDILAIASWPLPARATQIPLLHLFPACKEDTRFAFPSRVARRARSCQRGPRVPIAWSATLSATTAGSARRRQALVGDGAFTDEVTVALFSTNPDDLGLYGNPWRATRRSGATTTSCYSTVPRQPGRTGTRCRDARPCGRFGYRLYYPRCGREPASCSGTCPAGALHPGGDQAELNEETLRLGRSPLNRPRPPARARSRSRPIFSIAPAIARLPSCSRASQVSCATPPPRPAQAPRFSRVSRRSLARSFARALLRIAKDTTLGACSTSCPSWPATPGCGPLGRGSARGHRA